MDIGSSAVKAVAIKKTKKSFDILQTHFFPIKVDESEEQKQLLISTHLKALTNLYQPRETKYIFSFSQNEVSTEKLLFPFKERYKILKSLPYQMEDKLSLFDHKQMISDIKLGELSEEKRSVLVFSVFKENVSHLLKEVKSVGAEPFIVTCEASATANLFLAQKKEDSAKKRKTPKTENTSQEPQKTNNCLYLKIGHTHTMALLFSRDYLQNVYSFEWGVSDCIRKISLKYEISLSKAMDQFREKAFVLTQTKGYTGSQIEFAKIIQESFENLIDKLRLVLLQIEGEKGKRKCKKILLCGGGAQVRNLQALLSTRLNIPVARVEQSPHFPKWNFRTNEIKQNNLITALGTAMEGLKKAKNPAVNFLKEDFAVQFNPFSFIMNQWKEPIALAVMVLVLFSGYSALRNHQSKELSQKTDKIFKKYSMQIAKLRPKQINIERVQHFVNSKKQWLEQTQLADRLNRFPSALDKIKLLSIAIKKQPSWNLKIQDLNITGNNIKMEGSISSLYIEVLEKKLMGLAIISSFKKSLNTTKPTAKNPVIKETDLGEKKPSEEKQGITYFKYSFTQKQG